MAAGAIQAQASLITGGSAASLGSVWPALCRIASQTLIVIGLGNGIPPAVVVLWANEGAYGHVPDRTTFASTCWEPPNAAMACRATLLSGSAKRHWNSFRRRHSRSISRCRLYSFRVIRPGNNVCRTWRHAGHILQGVVPQLACPVPFICLVYRQRVGIWPRRGARVMAVRATATARCIWSPSAAGLAHGLESVFARAHASSCSWGSRAIGHPVRRHTEWH